MTTAGVRRPCGAPCLATVVRAAVARGWRRSPRGLNDRWRFVEPVNRALLSAGAPAVAAARMRRGHRMLLDLRSGTEWFAYYTGAFDDSRLDLAAALLEARPGSGAVDAGANVGLWTVPLAAAAVRAGGHVIAVEPVPSNAARLRANVALNGLREAVTVREHGLSDRPTSLTLTLREDFAAGGGTGNASVVIDDGGDDGMAVVHVPGCTLDDVLDECGRPTISVVKADLEGHEDLFLAGARRTFGCDRPVAFVEWNVVYYERRGVDLTALTGPLLRDWDYRCLRKDPSGWVLLDDLISDKPLDDMILVPAERVDEVVTLLGRLAV